MDYDEDKIDEFTLALLYLVTHEREEGFGARAWKGFDWGTLDRLHQKGYISNPEKKTKSVVMTEAGYLKAEELFEQHFSIGAETKALPSFTASAKKRWDQMPEETREAILKNVWCANCRTGVSMRLRAGTISSHCLMLHGICEQCSGEVIRMIEPVKNKIVD
jgi:hypothetical protein